MAYAMTREHQTCPICGATNLVEATTCVICGARLNSVYPVSAPAISTQGRNFYDFQMGEDDLMAGRIPPNRWLVVGLVVMGLLLVGGLAYGLRVLIDGNGAIGQADTQPIDSPTPDFTASLLAGTPTITLTPSITRTPPPPLPTVTPTIEPSPTEGPCVVTVTANDTLSSLAYQCGHNSYDVIRLIVEMNNLSSESAIQVGQQLDIPRPTPTLNPTVIADPSSGIALPPGATLDISQASMEELIAAQQTANAPTLDPNLMYHTVAKDQTMYEIISIYGIDVKLLSEINPQLDFPQCDFGMQFGGPNCAVFFYEGQQVRVPAPTPTPTIPPTRSGSETPTPSPTATFNVPAIFGPNNGALFDAASVVTLRWTTTGTLDVNEVYKIVVRNLDTDESFLGFTCDLAFDLPSAWQADTIEFIEFEWLVSISTLTLDPQIQDPVYLRSTGFNLCRTTHQFSIEWDDTLQDSGRISGVALTEDRYPTAPRRFFWQGRG